MVNKMTRCSRYLVAMSDSIQGESGDDALYGVCCATYRFGLTEEEAFDLIQREYNTPKRCKPVWPKHTVREKLDSIHQHWPEERFGEKLNQGPQEKPAPEKNVERKSRQMKAASSIMIPEEDFLEPVSKRRANTASTMNFDYHDRDGKPYIRVTRMECPDRSKKFNLQHWNGYGYTSGIPKNFPPVPYHAVEFQQAWLIFWLEGDKKADALYECLAELLNTPLPLREAGVKEKLPFLRNLLMQPGLKQEDVCVSCGTNGTSCKIELFKEWFHGKSVVILPDHDVPGYRYAERVRNCLQGIAAEVVVLRWKNKGRNFDIDDYLNQEEQNESPQ